jgi:N-methylhydantoinase A
VRIGVDSGGTFTDFAWDGGVLKLPSTPHDPAEAIVVGIKLILATLPDIDPASVEIVHGTTVATNALLTRSGGRVALLTTAGFEDVIEIGRQDRPELYDLHPTLPPPLVPRQLRIGVHERVAVDGEVLTELTADEIDRLLSVVERLSPDAIAVCLLHSYAFPQHEERIGAAFGESDIPIFLSSELDPQPREFERTSTTVIHGYLAAKVQVYLRELERRLRSSVQILTSNGGMATVARASDRPADLVLSGPAGGVIGAAHVARLAGVRNFIGFDMGGTSTDVCLGRNGAVAEDSGRNVDGLPLRVPRLAVHTVGAGGGSIARAGLGGTLLVGPESAGADPGPAAYGRGDMPTVTDADIVLGRITETHFGGVELDPQRSRDAIGRLGEQRGLSLIDCAVGIVSIADQRMAHAAAEVSQARGYDPRRCTLIPFGGAGPLHACGVAEHLGIREILIPPSAGVLSAIGASVTLSRRDLTHSVMWLLEAQTATHIADLAASLRSLLAKELPRPQRFLTTLHCRYAGQSFELPVAFAADSAKLAQRFHLEHRRSYGYSREGEPIEVVSVRVTGVGGEAEPLPQLPETWSGLPSPVGTGPASWPEATCSVHIAAGWEWRLSRGSGPACLIIRKYT